MLPALSNFPVHTGQFKGFLPELRISQLVLLQLRYRRYITMRLCLSYIHHASGVETTGRSSKQQGEVSVVTESISLLRAFEQNQEP